MQFVSLRLLSVNYTVSGSIFGNGRFYRFGPLDGASRPPRLISTASKPVMAP